MRVGVIGAGATGLTAAYELGKHGHRVEVYEQDPYLGGQASTFDVGGARLERGYHHLFTGDTDILALIDEIGLGHRMRWIDSRVGTLYGGRIYKFVTPFDLLKFTPLSVVSRLRLGLVTLLIGRIKDWRSLEGITADEWLRRKVGRRAYEVFWGPMLRGKFGEDHFNRVGMPWVWAKIHTRFASRQKGLSREVLGYPAGSFEEVFEVLIRRIAEQGGEVHLSTPVSRVIVKDGRATGIEARVDGHAPSTEEFDAVIATTPSHVLPGLVPPLPDNYLSRLTGAEYMAAVLVVLVLDRPLSQIYWLNVADRSIPFVGVIEHTNLIEPEHYGGRHIVYLSNYMSVHHPMYRMDGNELLKAYLPHLHKVNPGFDESWITEVHHHRIDAAQPIIGTGYSARIPDHRTPFGGLYLANTTQVYPEDRGTNYSVRIGMKVAGMVMEDLSAS